MRVPVPSECGMHCVPFSPSSSSVPPSRDCPKASNGGQVTSEWDRTRGKQVASYLGLIPREHSSGSRQKLGVITKQGNRMMRMLLVEAAQAAVRFDPGLRKEYL